MLTDDECEELERLESICMIRPLRKVERKRMKYLYEKNKNRS
jgi:hypothetical protein